MEILKPEQIKQPVGALILEAPKEEDWHEDLGAVTEDINPSGDWRKSVTEFVLQRNDIFDDWSCVTYSLVNKVEIIINYSYNKAVFWSRRFISVLSGTRPQKGNSVNNPCEFLRKSGDVLESDYPSMSTTMTEQEFFQPIADSVKSKECFLNNWAYTHKYLPRDGFNSVTCSLPVLKGGLKISPIMVSVEGRYNYDARGRVAYGGGQYAHEVLIVCIEGDVAYVLDSENPSGFVPFDVNYPFYYPKIGYVREINPININDFKFMKLEPIRNTANGKIYIINTSNKKCWFRTEQDFIQLMGQQAWDEKQWTDVPPTQIEPLEDGVVIDFNNPSILSLLKTFVASLGKKS